MEAERLLEQYRRIPIQLKLVVLLLLTALVGAYSYYESVEMAIENLKKAEEEMAELDKQVESLNAAGQNIVAVQSEMRKADEEIAMLLDLLPAESEMERVLGFFAAAAKETGVEIKEFEPGKTDDPQPTPTPGAPGQPQPGGIPPPVIPVPGAPGAPGDPKAGKPPPPPVDESVRRQNVKVKLSGSFPQVVAFFDKVLGLPRVLRMTTFELRSENAFLQENQPLHPALVGRFMAPQKPVEPPPPKIAVVAEFDAYSQRGMLDQFKKEAEATPTPAPAAPVAPPAGAPNAEAPPAPGGDASLSAKPLGGEAP